MKNKFLDGIKLLDAKVLLNDKTKLENTYC